VVVTLATGRSVVLRIDRAADCGPHSCTPAGGALSWSFCVFRSAAARALSPTVCVQVPSRLRRSRSD